MFTGEMGIKMRQKRIIFIVTIAHTTHEKDRKD